MQYNLKYERLLMRLRSANKIDEIIEILKNINEGDNKLTKKTFPLTATDHRYHALWAYIPQIGLSERKQLPLDREKLFKIFQRTKKQFHFYIEARKILGAVKRCPCEYITEIINKHQDYVTSYNNKRFNDPLPRLEKNLNVIENLVNRFDLLPKKSHKRSTKSKKIRKEKSMSTDSVKIKFPEYLQFEYNFFTDRELVCGITLLNNEIVCDHQYANERNVNYWEIQQRAGDEGVSIFKKCLKCDEVVRCN